jgi:hypothetical protein
MDYINLRSIDRLDFKIASEITNELLISSQARVDNFYCLISSHNITVSFEEMDVKYFDFFIRNNVSSSEAQDNVVNEIWSSVAIDFAFAFIDFMVRSNNNLALSMHNSKDNYNNNLVLYSTDNPDNVCSPIQDILNYFDTLVDKERKPFDLIPTLNFRILNNIYSKIYPEIIKISENGSTFDIEQVREPRLENILYEPFSEKINYAFKTKSNANKFISNEIYLRANKFEKDVLDTLDLSFSFDDSSFNAIDNFVLNNINYCIDREQSHFKVDNIWENIIYDLGCYLAVKIISEKDNISLKIVSNIDKVYVITFYESNKKRSSLNFFEYFVQKYGNFNVSDRYLRPNLLRSTLNQVANPVSMFEQ